MMINDDDYSMMMMMIIIIIIIIVFSVGIILISLKKIIQMTQLQVYPDERFWLEMKKRGWNTSWGDPVLVVGRWSTEVGGSNKSWTDLDENCVSL